MIGPTIMFILQDDKSIGLRKKTRLIVFNHTVFLPIKTFNMETFCPTTFTVESCLQNVGFNSGSG